ncbi:GH32 C-terminal domain-containing protein [Streptomyces sp. NPDC005761]|uniref:GH32 C-terminal domain-containing protein n=1 Tax=Streptomyces sp. NPDC005761 TaxID=3157066 RepID=UPI0033DA2EEC
MFVDRLMIEAYANSHKSITTGAYPFRQDSLGLKLFGDGSVIRSMTIWKMGNMTDRVCRTCIRRRLCRRAMPGMRTCRALRSAASPGVSHRGTRRVGRRAPRCRRKDE